MGRGVLTVEGVVTHRPSLLCAIKPLREPLKPMVDAFVDVGRCWLVGTHPLSSMGGGGSSLFAVDRSGRSWMVVGACGGWQVLVVGAHRLSSKMVVVDGGGRLCSLGDGGGHWWMVVGARGWWWALADSGGCW